MIGILSWVALILMIFAIICAVYSIYAEIFRLPVAFLGTFVSWLVTGQYVAGKVVIAGIYQTKQIIQNTSAGSGSLNPDVSTLAKGDDEIGLALNPPQQVVEITNDLLTFPVTEPAIAYLLIFISIIITAIFLILFVNWATTIAKGQDPDYKDEGTEREIDYDE